MSADALQTDLSVTAEIKLYYDLFVPEAIERRPAPLLIAVHGYGAHKRYMMREARLIVPENYVIAAIQAPHQHYRQTDKGYKTGFGWLTDFKSAESVELHQKFVLDLIERLEGENLIDPDRIILYGFSQACALNFRFALTHPEILRGVLGVCGGIPSDLETNSNYQPPEAEVFYLYSTNDEFYPLEKYQTFDQKLRDLLPHYQSAVYEAKHEITEKMREDMKFWLSRI